MFKRDLIILTDGKKQTIKPNNHVTFNVPFTDSMTSTSGRMRIEGFYEVTALWDGRRLVLRKHT